ncbi:MAG: PTS sugar transporter subunit IIA [Erysipelotrichaceae bacterium]|nr:PTS sugar transporter subunit IIA [Erysipelotrichaceae bacterium]
MQQGIIEILNILVSEEYHFVSACCIKLSITRRQFIYRLEKINDILYFNELKQIKIKDDKFSLNHNQIKFFKELIKNSNLSYNYNLKERKAIAYILLFSKVCFLDNYALNDILKVSRSTSINTIKQLKDDFKDKEIDILYSREKGYYLIGEELEIRNYFTKIIIDLITVKRNTLLFDKIIHDYDFNLYDYVYSLLDDLSSKHNITYIKDKIREFIYLFIFLIKRIESGNSLKEAVKIYTGSKEYLFSLEFARLFNIKNENEVEYICAWVLASSVGDFQSDDLTDELRVIILKILQRFERLSASYFPNKEDAFEQIYSHFKPAYYRLIFKIPIYNPLTEKIKKEYFDIYNLVMESIKPLVNSYKIEIPTDEVAFLTMHFVLLLNLGKQEETNKPKACVVCTNGIAGSIILYNELIRLFPNLDFDLPIDYQNYKKNYEDYDIVFTSNIDITLDNLKPYVVKVNPIMSKKEKQILVEKVFEYFGRVSGFDDKVDRIMNALESYTDINDSIKIRLKDELINIMYENTNVTYGELGIFDLLEKDQIIFNNDIDKWNSALYVAGKPLVEKGYISKEYLSSILTAEYHQSYFIISPHLALPHTNKPEYVNKACMSFLIFDEEKRFEELDNKPIKYIVLLASKNNANHLSAMRELLELLEDGNFYEVLNEKDNLRVYDYIRYKFRINHIKS